jgi:hypothetical protein
MTAIRAITVLLLALLATAAVIPRDSIAEQNTDIILFEFSMTNFLDAKTNGDPSFVWTSDGCSKAPDKPQGFDFLPGCYRHDFGYRNYKQQGRFTEDNREKIDNNLKKDLYDVCAKYHGLESFLGVECRGIADLYFDAVRTFGSLDIDIPGL